MQAIVLKNHGDINVLGFSEANIQKPLADEIQVKVHAVGVNHLDLWVRKGVPGHTFPLPMILGSDVAGVVHETGGQIMRFKTGDEVVIAPGLSCGTCEACLYGNDNACLEYGILGESRDGGYAEYITVPEKNVFSKPSELSFAQAVSVGIPFLTAWHMLVNKAHIQPGETVLVQAGGSGVGSAAIQIAKFFHAKVITTVGQKFKEDKARSIGADVVINYESEDVRRAVRLFGNGRGVNIVVDHVGEKTWESSWKSLARHGRLVVCGATYGAQVQLNLRQLFFKSLSVLGSTMGTKAEYATVLKHVAAGELLPVIDRILPWSQAQDAHRLLAERQIFGKLVLAVV